MFTDAEATSRRLSSNILRISVARRHAARHAAEMRQYGAATARMPMERAAMRANSDVSALAYAPYAALCAAIDAASPAITPTPRERTPDVTLLRADAVDAHADARRPRATPMPLLACRMPAAAPAQAPARQEPHATRCLRHYAADV